MDSTSLLGGSATALPLHHVGIVFPDFEAATAYMNIFGHVEDYRGFVPEFECWCIFCKAPEGAAAVELVIPVGGPLAKFNRGFGGLHHYALVTTDLDRLRIELRERSVEMIYENHVKGAGPFLCNFLAPSYTRGVTVELVQLLDTKSDAEA